MVRITADLIARCTSGYNKKKREESVDHFLKRLTHLYLEDKNIDEVGDDIGLCRNLNVLYLYDNNLTRVPSLHLNQNLVHLFLQNNKIKKISNLHHLPKIEKLYLGGNELNVIEGLECLSSLQELHIENQRMAPGEKLLFDPRSLIALAPHLQVLNVSGNHLNSIRDFDILSNLTQFLANDNDLKDLREVAHCLALWRSLWRLELSGNPLAQKNKYRDRVIVMSNSLEILDGKEINDTSRKFLLNWKANKEANSKRRLSSKSGHAESLPPLSTHDGSQSYVMPGLQKRQFQEILAKTSDPKSGPYSDVAGPRYLNTMGTNYHITLNSTPSEKPRKLNLITIG